MKTPYNTVTPLTQSVSDGELPESVKIFVKRAFVRAKEQNFTPQQMKTLKKEVKSIIDIGKRDNMLNYNKWSVQHIPVLDGPGLKLDLYSNLTTEELEKLKKNKIGNIDITNKARNKTTKRKNIFGYSESESESDSDINSSERPFKIKKISSKATLTSDTIANLKKAKKAPLVTATTVKPLTDIMDKSRMRMRSMRFEKELKTSTKDVSYHIEPLAPETVVGTCTSLEKKYLRLTSQPKPENVRPIQILKKTLALLKSKYFDGACYNYLCDQCKSMRQDLTVQNIKNEFTVSVYEFHSKLAIEFGDLGEFNQCQSQLKLLYEESNLKDESYLEFTSYRLLYYILTNNRSEIDQLLLYITEENEKYFETPFIKLAFVIDKILTRNDCYGFQKVVSSLQEISHPLDELKKPIFYFFNKILHHILVIQRIKILGAICRAYRQIQIDFLRKQLLFSSEEELKDYLASLKLSTFYSENESIFVCHLARANVDALQSFNKRIDIKGQI